MRLILLYLVLFFLPQNSLLEEEAVVEKIPVVEEASLIVFLQKGKDQFFRTSCLPKLKAYAEQKGIALEEREAMDGLPAELTSTPAIVFQNYRGRSWYAGTYTSFSTIQNFIRTSRKIPQQNAADCKQQVATAKIGRTQLRAPLKISPLAGKLPKGFSEIEFQEKAEAAIFAGFKKMKLQEEVCLQKTDRTFYFDFHPYRDKRGQFFLSAEIYEQFSCIKPIWSNFGQVNGKSYENFVATFSDLADQMEAFVWEHLANSEKGGALSFVAADIPEKNWEELGLLLPVVSEEKAMESPATFAWSNDWVFAGAVDEFTPIIQFRFPAPLGRYAGEVKKLKGHLQLSKDHRLENGFFEAETQSLTMGIDDFDAKIHKEYIKAFKFPNSSFTFNAVEGSPVLKVGESSNMLVTGIFELMKIKQEIEVATQVTPTFDEADNPSLQVEASFSINITDDFKIKGPDGPSPAKKTLLFNLNFLLKAKS